MLRLEERLTNEQAHVEVLGLLAEPGERAKKPGGVTSVGAVN